MLGAQGKEANGSKGVSLPPNANLAPYFKFELTNIEACETN